MIIPSTQTKTNGYIQSNQPYIFVKLIVLNKKLTGKDKNCKQKHAVGSSKESQSYN